jgi:hypothetical protein
MSLRIIIAGIAGAVAMFVWMGLAHTVLGLAAMGVSVLHDEAPAEAALQAATSNHDGLFFFPAMDLHAKDQKAAMKAWEDKARSGPSGMVIYHAAGHAPGMTAGTLGEEGLKELIVSLLAAFMLTLTGLTRYWSRAGFIALIGLVATLTTNPSYLIWYGFPADYTFGYVLTDLLGYVFAGLAIAALLRPRLRVEI